MERRLRVAFVVGSLLGVLADETTCPHNYCPRAPKCSPRRCCGRPDAGPVLGGIDLVALKACVSARGEPSHPECAPEVGSVEADYKGYTFLFKTEANRDAFMLAPEPYLPATGGYCAFSLTGYDQNGAGFWCSCPSHEDGYAYVNGTAYFFLFGGAKAAFLEKGAGNATENCAALLHENGDPEACFNTARFTPVGGAKPEDDDDPCDMASCLAFLDCHDCAAS